TAVIVGDDGDRAAYARNLAANAAAPAPAKADRAAYYATGGSGPAGSARASNDVVGGIVAGKMSKMNLHKFARTALPPELRGLDAAALQAEIERRAQLRKDTEAEMSRLVKQRTEYLRANAKGGEGGFDAKVNATLDAQLK
ncbi:MAG TPA: hypothetical protein VF516_29225, partial [Kofleriaceae bacterium]